MWIENGDFELRMCHAQQLDQHALYKLTFSVANPPEQAYASPAMSIQASGTLHFYPTALDPPGEALLVLTTHR